MLVTQKDSGVVSPQLAWLLGSRHFCCTFGSIACVRLMSDSRLTLGLDQAALGEPALELVELLFEPRNAALERRRLVGRQLIGRL